MVADASPPSRSDEDAWCAALVERVAAGEAQALEELYDRYARPAYSLALRVTGDPTFAQVQGWSMYCGSIKPPTDVPNHMLAK